jgi:hypothetical protein
VPLRRSGIYIGIIRPVYCGGESSSSMLSAGTSNRSKDEIRNTQRREIVGTDMGTKDRYINVKNIFVLGWVKKY